jgi:hypothetical protein
LFEVPSSLAVNADIKIRNELLFSMQAVTYLPLEQVHDQFGFLWQFHLQE